MSKRSTNPICGIYCFIHKASGMCYIGSSLDIKERRLAHIRSTRNGRGSYFGRQVAIIGLNEFDFEIIEICKECERLEREKFFIVFYKSKYPNGFNMVSDPTKGWDYLYTDEMLAKKKAQKTSVETRLKISKAGIGRKHTLETRMKIGSRHKGRVFSDETRMKMRLAKLGTKFSDEVRKNMSLSKIGNTNRRGFKTAEETKILLSKAGKGLKRSPETRARMKIAQRIRFHPEITAT